MVTKSNRCDYLYLDNSRCGAKHEVKFILFRDPNTRNTEEVSLCAKHFGENIEEPLLLPIKKMQFKLSNQFSKMNRDRQMAKQSDIPVDFSLRKAEIDKIRKQIIHEKAYKCSNVVCGKALNYKEKSFSMMVFDYHGKLNHKFYLCSEECFRKMKLRVGLIKVDLVKVHTLQEYENDLPVKITAELDKNI